MVVIIVNMNHKNKMIEEYIINISKQVNDQYGKELIDEDKISRALTMFKDSSDDLETEIIPKINATLRQVLANNIKSECHKQYDFIKKLLIALET